jgi:hypothetical protein
MPRWPFSSRSLCDDACAGLAPAFGFEYDRNDPTQANSRMSLLKANVEELTATKFQIGQYLPRPVS